MLDRIVVPTDNIYKFIALFSLVVLIFCGWQSISFNTEVNSIVFKNYPEMQDLRALDARSRVQDARLAVLDRQIEIATQDRKFYNSLLGFSMAIAILGLVVGFGVWYRKIQPLVDAQSKAQLEILQLEIEKIKLENRRLADSLKAGDDPSNMPAAASRSGVVGEA
ncbi:hypothetical protein [Acidovorax sp. SUPP2539]|uniref:hypothetical protein n=1 Tax=Acidovorax sp. SUPP2539 TaxID=2920878 RepID=UPI0023DE3556|nr:hypothetical protein [Acidovorax sp. SUPP2539]GKS92196.1 hypothetical protein AVTE2539_22545 [Acidovorax sp. SUPP2539]